MPLITLYIMCGDKTNAIAQSRVLTPVQRDATVAPPTHPPPSRSGSTNTSDAAK